MATIHSQHLAPQRMATVLFHGDLQRFGRKFPLCVATAAEGLRALMLQIPPLRQHLQNGWYQVRIAGRDISPDEFSQQVHAPLPDGAVIHVVPRMAGAKHGVFQFIAGAVMVGLSFVPGFAPVTATYLMMSGSAMMLGGVARMLTPTPRTAASSQTDNGKENSYFSSTSNLVAQGNCVPVPYGEILVGSREISKSSSIWDGSGDTDVILGKVE